MPRQARLDAPGVLQHLIGRSLERRALFRDDVDQDAFVTRLAHVLTATATPCLAWAPPEPCAPAAPDRPGAHLHRHAAASLVCCWAVRELGLSETAVGAALCLSQPAVSRAVARGAWLVAEEQLQIPVGENRII
jgi:hypothetical protein